MNLRLYSYLSWIITISVPLALIGLAVRLILTPLFLQIEYRMPYFPADSYGFTQTDRLYWSQYAWDYLLKDVEANYLGDLKFQNGNPLYNPRELQHMLDVKQIITMSLITWYLILGILLVFGLWSWHAGWLDLYRIGVRRGGWLMVGLAALIGLVVTIGIGFNPDVFWKFFTGFHQLFFEGDSWLFAYSDTLIRLFPIRFWQDAFLFAALITLSGGILLGLGLKSI